MKVTSFCLRSILSYARSGENCETGSLQAGSNQELNLKHRIYLTRVLFDKVRNALSERVEMCGTTGFFDKNQMGIYGGKSVSYMILIMRVHWEILLSNTFHHKKRSYDC